MRLVDQSDRIVKTNVSSGLDGGLAVKEIRPAFATGSVVLPTDGPAVDASNGVAMATTTSSRLSLELMLVSVGPAGFHAHGGYYGNIRGAGFPGRPVKLALDG